MTPAAILQRALISRNAERMMCATYTRKLAQKKANALLQKMPSAVVIVDEDLKIIECNSNFVRLFSSEDEPAKNLEGSALSAVMPFSYLFRRVLESSEDIVGHDIRYQRSILTTSIFTIEPHSVMCGIFQDITEPHLPEGADHRSRPRGDPEEPEDGAADCLSSGRECRRLRDYSQLHRALVQARGC